jgi:hypothetical protein
MNTIITWRVYQEYSETEEFHYYWLLMKLIIIMVLQEDFSWAFRKKALK